MVTKKGGRSWIEGFEGPIGTGMREILKAEVPKVGAVIREKYPQTFDAVWWAFNMKSPDANALQTKLMTGLVFISWLGERLTDLLGEQSTPARLAEIAMGDFPSAIKDYFQSVSHALPADYKVESTEFDKVVEDLKNQVKEYFTHFMSDGKSFIRRVRDYLKKAKFNIPFIGNPLQSKVSRVIALMFTTEDDALVGKILQFQDVAFMKDVPGSISRVPDEEAIRDFDDMAENWDTLEEVEIFFSKPLNMQLELFAKARLLRKHTGWRRRHHDASHAIQAGGKAFAGVVETANTKLEEHNKKLRAEDRQQATRNWKIAGVVAVMIIIASLYQATFERLRFLWWAIPCVFALLAAMIYSVVIIYRYIQRRKQNHA